MFRETLLIIAICIGASLALTSEEIAQFETTGDKEQNTGLVGWVKVSASGSNWIIESNGIPDHDTADWPGQNPNEILEQNYRFIVPMWVWTRPRTH